jgi:hypothetical protein
MASASQIHAGTYEVIQIDPMTGIEARAGDSVYKVGDIVHYDLANLSVTATAPYASSRGDERMYTALTIYKVKWTPAPGETSHPGTVDARVRVKSRLRAYAWSGGQGVGSLSFQVNSAYKAIGPSILLQVSPPTQPYGYQYSWQADSGTAPEYINISDEYIGFAFQQNAEGEWVSTQSFPVSFFQKAGVTTNRPYVSCGAISYAKAEFKMVQISDQILDSSY